MRVLLWMKTSFKRLDENLIHEDSAFDWVMGRGLVFLGILFVRGDATIHLSVPSGLAWLDQGFAMVRPYVHAMWCGLAGYHFLRRGMVGDADEQ